MREGQTHGVDSGQLLGELQDDGDEERLAEGGRAEELEDGHLGLHRHLGALLLHLPQVFAHVLGAAETHQSCEQKRQTQEETEETVTAATDTSGPPNWDWKAAFRPV